MSEGNARIMINKLLSDSEWKLPSHDHNANVQTEVQNSAGFADYVLLMMIISQSA